MIESHFSEQPTTPKLFRAENLSKSYGKKQILRGVSLQLARGEAVGLLGPNGAGKTTCFYALCGLIGVDTGAMWLDELNITHYPMHRRAREGIGYLPQEHSVFRDLSVEKNIMAFLEFNQKDKKRRQDRLESLLDAFKLTSLRKQPSLSLSGGERRRLEIARCLACEPRFILLDEPFAGVDPLAIGDLKTIIRALTRADIGVLITDHQVRETLRLCHRAYILYDGMVLKDGQASVIASDPEVRQLYLGDALES